MATNYPVDSPSCEDIEAVIEQNLEEYKWYFINEVDPKDFLMFYPVFSHAERRRLNNLLKNIPDPAEKWQEIFDTIHKTSSVEQRYTKFVETLVEEEYTKIADVLQGKLVPVKNENRKKLNNNMKAICELLELRQLLGAFKSAELISQKDFQVLNGACNTVGVERATGEFVLMLPCKHKDWYVRFLRVLIENNHLYLAETIDEEMVAKIKQSRDSGGQNSFSGAASCVPASVVDVQRKRIKQSRDNVEQSLISGNASCVPTSVTDDQRNKIHPENADTMEHVMKVHQDPSMDDLDQGQPRSDVTELSSMMNNLKIGDLKLSLNPEKAKAATDLSPESAVKMQLLEEPKIKSELLKDSRQPIVQECQNQPPEFTCTDTTSPEPDLSQFQRLTRAKPVSSDESKIKPVYTEETSLKTVGDIDYSSMSECNDETDISLRDYQMELASAALNGENVIIVAPTGSGKTRVALRIIQEHMRKMKGRGIAKVIFLVNQVALANQQAEACRQTLKNYQCEVISGDTQRSKNVCLKDFVDKRDILVVTAQVLLDALVNGDIESINMFSLLIFDECHHTHANHTFNQIMSLYMELKLQEDPHPVLPQIVGLTASVGVGKARNVDKAVEHIKKLMANLDTNEICTVNTNMAELRKHVSLPEEETCTVRGRVNDLFGDKVFTIMNNIETRMCEAPGLIDIPESTQFANVLKAPADKGNAQYTQWVKKLWKEIAKIRNEPIRRYLNPCRTLLDYYNNSLIIYNDARTKDALTYLETEMKRWRESCIMTDIERTLDEEYDSLKKLNFKDCSVNPKLEKLCDMVTKAYRGDEAENSRGIVFVKTRDLARAIVSWMKETPGLKELNPIPFLGQNSTTTGGGMTKGEQDNALKYFKNGKHKLIVATSVAEEGLDISKCNLVIRYDHVTNEIAMVQSRGRGRAQDSKYYVLAEEGTGVAEKEELNMIREVMMRHAIKKLQEDIARSPKKVRSEIEEFQKESNLDRCLKSLGKRRRIIRNGEFELRCYACSEFVCMSTDIKKIKGAHHVVTDETLNERVEFVEGGSTKHIDDTIQFTGKLICKNCGDTLGVICIHRSLQFPVLKIEKLLIVDMNGRQDTGKKWNKVPFTVRPLTGEDLKNIYDQRKQDVE